MSSARRLGNALQGFLACVGRELVVGPSVVRARYQQGVQLK